MKFFLKVLTISLLSGILSKNLKACDLRSYHMCVKEHRPLVGINAAITACCFLEEHAHCPACHNQA